MNTNTHSEYIPQIPPTVRARFNKTHLVLTGAKEDCERLMNGLFNFSIVCAVGEGGELDNSYRLEGTIYKKSIIRGAQALCEMGGERAAVPSFVWKNRRKHDKRKQISIAEFRANLILYKKERLPLLRAALNAITEDIGERAEVIEGRKGRGLAEFAGV